MNLPYMEVIPKENKVAKPITMAADATALTHHTKVRVSSMDTPLDEAYAIQYHLTKTLIQTLLQIWVAPQKLQKCTLIL
jgi:hypothetical protein